MSEATMMNVNLPELNAKRKAWAEHWTAKLWEPWHIWRVRYVHYDHQFNAGDLDDRAIETVYTLDEPEDILRQMNPVAEVDAVDRWGEVFPGFAIATFLDGRQINFDEPSIEETLPYHRTFWCGTYCVNVPAFVLTDPDPFK